MRELERESVKDDPVCPEGAKRLGPHEGTEDLRVPQRACVLAIVGRGRLGTALAAELAAGGRLGTALAAELAAGGRLGTALAAELPAGANGSFSVIGPFGRGYDGAGAHAVLLAVPDAEIAGAAAVIAPGPLVGHCSGATRLDVLGPHEAFSFHPLIPVIPGRAKFADAAAAVAGSSERALAFAASLARAMRMRPVEIDEENRPAYHAAASIASNFLVTLEAAAEELAAGAGISRELLAPLVRATVENWAALGPERALTGPVARGDEATVAAQRTAVAERAPHLLALFDALVDATRGVAGRLRSNQERAGETPGREPAVA